jgi:tRNA dimethylallyltransferase
VRDAVSAIEGIYSRGRWPILVGGTGLYYRALARGLFPGPAADAAMRARLEEIARRRGVGFLHRMVARVDPPSAERILQRDLKRLVRCLEVYFLTGTPLTAHFADTVSPLKGYETVAVGLSIPLSEIAARTARRDEQTPIRIR